MDLERLAARAQELGVYVANRFGDMIMLAEERTELSLECDGAPVAVLTGRLMYVWRDERTWVMRAGNCHPIKPIDSIEQAIAQLEQLFVERL